MANKERTRVSPRQMLVQWQKELGMDKDSNRGVCWNLGRGNEGKGSQVYRYAGRRLAERHLSP